MGKVQPTLRRNKFFSAQCCDGRQSGFREGKRRRLRNCGNTARKTHRASEEASARVKGYLERF